MARIVLDTNSLVSAIGWNGNQRKILADCINHNHILLESEDLIGEFEEVIRRDKFRSISKEEIGEFLVLLKSFCVMVYPREKISIIKEDPDDNIIIECALEGKADFIISGDAHLINLKIYKDIKIVSAKEFLSLA